MMSKFITLIVMALLVPLSYLTAQRPLLPVGKTILHALFVKLDVPDGWTIKNIDGESGYLCSSPDEMSTILVVADAENSLAYYNGMLPTGVDLGEGVTIRSHSKLISLSTNKAYSTIDLIGQNGKTAGTVGIMQKRAGGVLGLIGVSQQPSLQTDVKNKLLNMLSSCIELNSVEIAWLKKVNETGGTQVLKQWYSKLNNTRIQKYSSYSSGYSGGGMSSSIYYDLCAGGYYRMYSQFNSSIGSSSDKSDVGRWILRQEQGSIYLELSSDNNGVSRFSISSDTDLSVYLNKVKYLIGRSGDVGPRCK